MRLSLEAVFRMRAATIAAPKPLSMLTTDTPGELETRADSRGVMPCNAAPKPTLVGTATCIPSKDYSHRTKYDITT